MAYRFTGASSHYMELGSSMGIALDDPVTLLGWGNSADTTTDQHISSIGNNTAQNAYRLLFAGNVAGDPIRARKSNNSSQASSDTGAYVANRWTPAVAMFLTNTSRYAWKDFTLAAQNTTSLAHSANALNTTYLGCYYNGSARTNFFNGNMAEVGFVAGVITPNEMHAFASGIPLDEIFSNRRLLAYLPLHKDTGVTDLSQYRRVFTNNGAVPVADHPQIIRRPKRRFYFVPEPSGGPVAGSVDESGSAADSASAALVAVAPGAESVSSVDTSSAVHAAGVAAAETVSSADAASSSHVAGVTVAETASTSDVASALAVFASALAEVATGSDSPSALVDFAASIAETLSAIDEASDGYSGALVESASAADSTSAVIVVVAACAESIAAADSPSSAVDFLESLTESVNAGDLTAAAAIFESALAEIVAGSDSPSVLAAFLAGVAEAMSASDSASAAGADVFTRDPEFSFRQRGRFAFRPRVNSAFRPRGKFSFRERP